MKKYLLYGGIGLVVVIAAYFLLMRRKQGSGDDIKTIDSQSLINAANSYFGNITPLALETKETNDKGEPKELVTKAEFENAVRAIIMQIANEPPPQEWLQGIDRMRSEWWTDVKGLELPEAVHVRARNFIAQQLYYQ